MRKPLNLYEMVKNLFIILYPVILILSIQGLTGCTSLTGTSSESDMQGSVSLQTKLIILAAASLTESFQEIGEAFEKSHPGVETVFNFAASQQLVQQLIQGAPADVFASANQEYMDLVIADGRILAERDHTFIQNALVVVLPNENPAQITQLQDLANPGLRLVLAAKEVPIGSYTQEFLSRASQDASFNYDYTEKVNANVVSYENNVKAVLSKVILGEADAGIVYTSDISGGAAKKIIQLRIPESMNIRAVYAIAALADSHHPTSAEAFIDFVLSTEGQAIMVKHGFIAIGQ